MERDQSPRSLARASIRSLNAIKRRMLAIDIRGPEPQRALEIEQLAVYRVYYELSQRDVLPLWVETSPRSRREGGLWLWAELICSLEGLRPDLPRVNDISDWQVPVLGQRLPLHIAPADRIGLWISISVAIIDALVEMLEAAFPLLSAGTGEFPEETRSGRKKRRSRKGIGGRPPVSKEDRDTREQLLQRCEQAIAEGVSMQVLAERECLTFNELRHLIEQARKWRRHAEKPPQRISQ